MTKPPDCNGPRARVGLRLAAPVAPEAGAAVGVWRINGHPARLLVWTPEQWARLDHRPVDAQYLACGVWCALRLD